jgi:hypothetical protein
MGPNCLHPNHAELLRAFQHHTYPHYEVSTLFAPKAFQHTSFFPSKFRSAENTTDMAQFLSKAAHSGCMGQSLGLMENHSTNTVFSTALI